MLIYPEDEPVTTQKEKHDGASEKLDIASDKLKKHHKNEVIRQQLQQDIRNQLETMPRYNYKAVRFYRHGEEMQKAIDMLSDNNIKNINSKTLTENYLEEIYERYMILPGEYSRILKNFLVGGMLGAILGLFQGIGLVALPLLNPVSAGGAAVSTVLVGFATAILCAAFRGILLLFKPIPGISPGCSMLTVYGSYEDKKLIEKILKESVTIDI